MGVAWSVLAVSVAMVVPMAGLGAMLPGGCAGSPAAAVEAVRLAPAAGPAAESAARGFRVVSVRWDAVLKKSWAVIGTCGDASRPAVTVLTDLPPAGLDKGNEALVMAVRADAVLPVVRAGDLVRLWRSDSGTHIEMMAVAEQNGGVGGRVRVRLVAPKGLEGDGEPVAPRVYLAGVVRGPADVELQP